MTKDWRSESIIDSLFDEGFAAKAKDWRSQTVNIEIDSKKLWLHGYEDIFGSRVDIPLENIESAGIPISSNGKPTVEIRYRQGRKNQKVELQFGNTQEALRFIDRIDRIVEKRKRFEKNFEREERRRQIQEKDLPYGSKITDDKICFVVSFLFPVVGFLIALFCLKKCPNIAKFAFFGAVFSLTLRSCITALE